MNHHKKKSSVKHLIKQELLKEKYENKIIFCLFFTTTLTAIFLLMFLISHVSMTGYATYLNTQAGSVTEVDIYKKFPTSYWSGLYGLALRVPDFTELLSGDFESPEIIRQDVFFDCVDSNNDGGSEVYASRSDVINFDNLNPAPTQLIDDYIGCSGKVDCASETFDETMWIMLGTRNISNIPATHTYRYDGDKTIFDLGILHDGTNLIFVTHIDSVQKSYNPEKLVNYQMILPAPEGEVVEYYFFTDPNDECPAGSGIGENILANITGKTYDENNNLLSNVSINVAGYQTYSDVNGDYYLSFLVLPGSYNLIASKDGYDDSFLNISVDFDNYSLYEDIYLDFSTPGLNKTLAPRVDGYVRDEIGGAITDVEVSLGNSFSYTDANGYYSLLPSIAEGNNSIVAIKQNYGNYYATLYFDTDTIYLSHNITMTVSTYDYQFETGPYDENNEDDGKYDEIPEEVLTKGEDHWISAKSIKKEVRQNTFVTEEVSIYNFRDYPLSLSFVLPQDVEDFIRLDKKAMTVSPDTFGTFTLTFYGIRELGSYNATLNINGDLENEIPIEVKIVEKKFPIESLLMNIEMFQAVVQPGDVMKYKLNLQNLLRGQSYQVKVYSKVKNLNTSEIVASNELLAELESSKVLLDDLLIPENVSEGEYVLEVEADYLNMFSIAKSPFVISNPIYLYSFFGIPLWMVFAMVSFMSFIFLNLFLYRKYQNRKKRYKVEVDYSTLPEPGEKVVKLGLVAESKHPAYYEIERLTTHAIVAGATGMGKSISAQVIIEEALMQNVAVIVFDPTAQWSGMLRKCTDKKMMSYYPKFGLKETDARAFKGNVRQVQDAKQVIDINKHINPGQIQIFSLNKLDPKDMDIFVANVIRQVFRSDPKESPNLKVLVVFDEVHRLLAKFGGSGEGFLQIERACREFRKWGIGVMLISQVLNDFVGEIKANINTEVQTRTLEENDLERIKTKFGDSFLKSLVRAEVGVAMFQNAEYNRGRPYFVNFRPILHSTRRLPDEELEKYNKYNDMVDDIEDQIAQLEAEKVDSFDLKMELKLVKDKIMSGSFSVVEIYLEGLKPRVAKEWEKLGKKPKERKIEMASEAEIKASIEEAKKERERATAEESVKKVEEKVVEKEEKEDKKEEKVEDKKDSKEKDSGKE